MTTQELKQYIDKVLGNNLRCLLPSYWWKRLFNQVADRIDEVTENVGDMVVKSFKEFEAKHPDMASNTLVYTEDASSAEARKNAIIIHSWVVRGQSSTAETKIYPLYIAVPLVNGIEGYYILSPIYRFNSSKRAVEFLDVPMADGQIYNISFSILANGEATHELVSSKSGDALVFGAERYAYVSIEKDVAGNITESELTDEQIAYNQETVSLLASGENVYLSYDGTFWMKYGHEISGSKATYFFSVVSLSMMPTDKLLGRMMAVSSDGSIAILNTTVGGSSITIDSELSTSSTNPVQNKVITAALNNKVDKVNGKQLSTEDFTTALKTKLEGLSNYDDTSIQNAVNSLTTQIDTLVSGDASVAIESFNEIIAFLNGVEDSESLDSIIAAIEQQIAAKQDKLVSGTNIKTINGESILGEGNIVVNVDTSNLATKEELNAKQDVIEDLETIRSGAAKGATALQEHQDISHLASKEELQNLQNEVIANEEVVASAFNDVNERINALTENVSGEAATKVELAESVATINETINANDKRYDSEFSALDDRIDELAANVSGKTVTKVEFEETITNLTNEILDNEEVVASAFNDVNVRINELAENVSGEAATKVELNDAVDTINQTIQTNDSRYAQEFSSLDTQIKQLAANVQGEAVTKTEFQETLSDLNNEILDNEEVVASAINDLNARIVALEDIIATLQNS